MSAKFYILFLNILLLIFLPLGIMAQENQAVTDFVTESVSEFTLQPEVDNIYLTCDFDLENIESLLQYLPDTCTEIYYGRINDSTLYDLYLEESQSFAKFYEKLNVYELRNQPNGDKVELSEYPFEVELRSEAYTTADWALCITTATNSVTDYLNCLIAKRLEMEDLIPTVEANVRLLEIEEIDGKEI